VFKLNIFRRKGAGKRSGELDTTEGLGKIAIVGSPNVGKSVVFNRLTGSRAVISNYPGTTVDVLRGKTNLGGRQVEIVDTPGMYSLLPITEEERVARAILVEETPGVVLHVVDTKNLERMLSLTLQLIEARLPVVLQLNMMDEAESAGIEIDTKKLEQELGVPVVATVAVTGKGMETLREILTTFEQPRWQPPLQHGEDIEDALERITGLLTDNYGVSKRSVGLLLLEKDEEISRRVREKEGDNYGAIQAVVSGISTRYSQPINYVVTLNYRQRAKDIVDAIVTSKERTGQSFAERLSRATMHPLSGGIIFLFVVFVGLYLFVGVFGAGILVDLIEGTLFGEWINPWLTDMSTRFIPWQVLHDLLVGDYGVFTLGLTYAFAIVFPIVGTFSLVFAIIEDSGYLPRLAMLIDRLFKVIGLNGRAVIPIVLGFGCDTMATIVTRTQETKRERVITTLLLALAIPCSAQLGVIFGILSGNTAALLIWIGTILMVFLLTGFLASRVLPGKGASFYMEVPPLRLPRLSNVLSKTAARLEWYIVEVLPMFLIASVVLWLGDLTGVFDIIVSGLEPVVEFIGVPGDATPAFLYGFFRRDFGAAGLYELHSAGILNGIPLLVSAVTITLFVPCIAQFLIMIKERGIRTALAIALFVFPFAFLVGFVLNRVLIALGVTL